MFHSHSSLNYRINLELEIIRMILAVSRRIQAANKRTKGLGEEKDSSKTRLSMVKKKASREMK